MKKVALFFGVICLIVAGGFYVTHRDYQTSVPQEQYPLSMGAISCNDLIQQADQIPPKLKQALDTWVHNNQQLLNDILMIPHFTSYDTIKQYQKTINAQLPSNNLSENNYIFEIESKAIPAVVKLSGIQSRISNMISSLGYDPYRVKWWTRNDLISQATQKNIPTQQHITRAATQQLLSRLKKESVRAIPTYLYHIPGRPTDCDDRNYIIVQEKLSRFSSLASLSSQQKIKALKHLNLKELYEALKYANLWNLTDKNLWIDNNYDIAYPDGEKPNNEGHGAYARWNVAILGNDLEKAKFNVRNWFDGGHRAFEKVLQRYLPERVAEWMQLYEQDPTVK